MKCSSDGEKVRKRAERAREREREKYYKAKEDALSVPPIYQDTSRFLVASGVTLWENRSRNGYRLFV